MQREAPGPWIHFSPHHFSIHCLPSIDQFGADNIREHLETLVSTPPRPNLQSVGAILKNPGNDWINDDEVITTEWDEHVCPAIQPVAGDEFNIKTLSKPSGPLNAHLTIVLHYPTFVTDRILAASTFDPSNHSLAVLHGKIGATTAVKVQDRVMARHEFQSKVIWSDRFRFRELV